MLYIEEIPRKEGSPFYKTDLTLSDIDSIRQWILENCDTSKRHVITEQRLGPVKAEGIQIKIFYGYNSYKNSPYSTIVDHVKKNHQGFKTFLVESEALQFYKDSLQSANAILDQHEVITRAALKDLSDKGVNFDAWADASDDTGLQFGLCIDCHVNGFYFSRKL